MVYCRLMVIGIRTTEINDGNGNIVMIRYSEVSNVANMTKGSSLASCDMQIEYGEPLDRDLRRETKLVFDEHGVNVPYPQVVVHQPREFQKATVMQQMGADRFNGEQKEASRDIVDDDDRNLR